MSDTSSSDSSDSEDDVRPGFGSGGRVVSHVPEEGDREDLRPATAGQRRKRGPQAVIGAIDRSRQQLESLQKEVLETHPADLVLDSPNDMRIARAAVVRIQSLYRGASFRKLLLHSDTPIEGVNEQRRGIWRLNKRRGEIVHTERSAAQVVTPAQASRIFVFLEFGEVVRVAAITCKAWLAGARAPTTRQAMLTLVTQASLRRIWSSTFLQHIGSIHASLRVCVSPLALDFDLFQSYWDLSPKDCLEIAQRFPALTELVGCVRHDSVNSLVPQSPIGIHGHLYGGRTGQPVGSEARRQSLLPGGGIIPAHSRLTLGGALHGGLMTKGSSAYDGTDMRKPTPPAPLTFQIAFPSKLQKLTLEVGLPAPQAQVAVKEIGHLASLVQLTLLTISELDLSPLLALAALRSLSIRYSNLTGKTTRLRFPRRAQYAVLRRMSQLTSLEVEEGFLVEPPAQASAGIKTETGVKGCYLHELLLAEEAPGSAAAFSLPAIVPRDLNVISPTAASRKVVSAHSLQLEHLHMEKTTLLRGNEHALTTLPSTLR